MQPLTRHGHRGHAVFVLPARPRRAAGTGRQPHPPCEKRAPPRRAPLAPPAAPPQKIRPAAPKFGSTARPRHAAGDRRPPKRAVWQPHRARPCRKILLLAAAPRPHRPARHISSHNPANRAKIGQHPTGRTAPAPPQKQSGSSAPVPKHAPPPVRAGARFPFVRFVPSSSMSRSAQSQEPRRTIAKTTARYGMGRSAARMVSGEHRKSRSARPQEPPRSRPRQPAPVQSAASSSALGS